jgi:hypothetical protein
MKIKMKKTIPILLVAVILGLVSGFCQSGVMAAERHSIIRPRVMAFLGASQSVARGLEARLSPAYDCGDDEIGVEASFICERGAYQAWFGFELPGVTDMENVHAITFTAYMLNVESESAQRTLWYDPDDSWIISESCPGTKTLTELVGTIVQSEEEMGEKTFYLDLSKHDWRNDFTDGHVGLMLTGPLDGSHLCGVVALSESGLVPYMTIIYKTSVPALNPWGMIALSVFIAGSVCWILRRRQAPG